MTITEPPRRMPPSQEQIIRQVVRQTKTSRQTRWTRNVARSAVLGALRFSGIFAIVEHGDDPNIMRPAVMLVFWVGAAIPVNALDYDLRYPANVSS